MPDENKLAVMEAAGYRVVRSCATCGNAKFYQTMPWGLCEVHPYQHLKHGREHHAPCHSGMTCDDWVLDEDLEGYLGSYWQHVGKP